MNRRALDVSLAALVAAGAVAALLWMALPRHAARHYPLRGSVVGVNSRDGTVVVRHDSIPGIMPAMTMPFQVEPREASAALRPGDVIEASLDPGQGSYRLSGIRVVARDGGPRARPAPPAAAPADTARLPNVRLRDSGGRRFRTSDLLGGPVALGFLSTRCPVPDACPRLARLLSETQELIGTPTELRGRARLLTVTLDPAYDTPARLARYGREREADPALWILATGDSAALAGLRLAAHIKVRGSGARLSHGQVLVVYRPDGREFRRVQGLRWTPRELAQILEDASR